MGTVSFPEMCTNRKTGCEIFIVNGLCMYYAQCKLKAICGCCGRVWNSIITAAYCYKDDLCFVSFRPYSPSQYLFLKCTWGVQVLRSPIFFFSGLEADRNVKVVGGDVAVL